MASVQRREAFRIACWRGGWSDPHRFDGPGTVLIPRIAGWYDRKHGQVYFYLTQFLTGNGCFRKYLNNMRKVESPCCVYCKEVQGDARHTFFECKRWDQERMELELEIGSITPENIVGKMLAERSNWTKVDKTVCDILKKKKAEENWVRAAAKAISLDLAKAVENHKTAGELPSHKIAAINTIFYGCILYGFSLISAGTQSDGQHLPAFSQNGPRTKVYKLISVETSPAELQKVTLSNPLNGKDYDKLSNNCQNWVKAAAKAISSDLAKAVENHKTSGQLPPHKLAAMYLSATTNSSKDSCSKCCRQF
uniref:Reverse transcriptase zinc-binding domain-containing protein n=1 Tax=Rhodnius prolixus TaxID=13249 RepID=T1HPR0_RHOPR